MNLSSDLYKNPIGAYYFKYEGDDLILLRLYKIKTKNRYLFVDENNKKVSLSKLQFSEFTMLAPDGILVHVLASDPNQGVDTVCLLYRMEDIEESNIPVPLPYAVCRQNIIDPFEMLLNNNPNKTIVGVSISQDTTPEGFDFKSVCMASGIRYQKLHFIYKDDTFEDMFRFINEELFDKSLKVIKEVMDESDNIKFEGFKDTYRELLEENDFMYDFRRAFKIVRINFTIDTSVKSWTEDGIYKISEKEVNIIESITKHQVINPILIKYDKTVDLEAIKRHYIVFEDLNKKIYVISYDKGNYINREYDALSDQRDKELLLKKMYK